MPALVLLPPLPPEPVPTVAHGQQCFGFFEVFVFARASVPRKARVGGIRAPRHHAVDARQIGLPDKTHRPRRIPTKLRAWERAKMHQDVADLTAAGAYMERPIRGNGIDGDCKPGPCPWISCRANLFITIRPSGKAIKFNFPGKDIDEVGETCAFRVAAKTAAIGEPLPFRKLGKYTNETYARIEQINGEAMVKFAKAWLEMYPDDPPPKFRKE